MANRFLSNIRINDAYTFPASDGSSGQVITTDGSGNLSFAEAGTSDAASVIYRDNFTGDGSTVAFDLQNSITDEDQTQIYIDGVYQEKDTYSVSGTTITFATAPISGHSVEVISISAINTGPTVIYQDNFTGNGSSTDFTLANAIDNEVKTLIFLNGVYQFKNTYTVDGTTLAFDAAPANNVDIEVISIASALQTDSLQAGSVIVPVKNTHTASIAKGTPVYITGNVGNSERLQIAPADASNSAKMPAAGLLLTTLAVNEEGYVITGGYLRNLTTDTIDGTSTSPNNTVYVKPGGGLTMTKPTGSNLIQNIAKVARSAANSGSLLVSSILRTNDVPNITNDYFWLGNSSGVATATSYTSRFDTAFATKDTDDLSEGTSNLYYTDARARSAISASGNAISYNSSTGVITSNYEESPTFTGNITFGDSHFIGDDADDNLLIQSSANENIIINSVDDLFLRTGGTTKLIVKNGGNVGIGTTSPSTKLHLGGTAPLDSIIRQDSTVSGTNWEIGERAAGKWQIWEDDGDSVVATFMSTGNVGIGITSPSKLLHLYGADATVQIQGLGTSSDAGVDFFPRDGSNVAHLQSIKGVGSNLTFLTGGNSGNSYVPTERMRIDSSGNVGIQNTSPSSFDTWQRQLVVGSGTADAGITIYHGSGGGNQGAIAFADGNTGTDRYRGSISYNGADEMKFFTSTIERIKINDAGNVFISTPITNAFYGLSLTYNNTNTADFTVNQATGQIKIGGVSAGYFPTFYAGGSERMRITSAGQVQVGYYNTARGGANTTFMTGKSGTTYLELNGGDTNGEGGILFADGSGGNYGLINYSHVSDIMQFYTASAEKMRITSAGNVGIGTTNPQAALDISSNYSIQGGVYTYYYTGTATGQSNINLDITVNNEGGGGNVFKIEAGFAHYYGMSYNSIGEWWCTSRGTNVVNTYILNAGSAAAGSWSSSKPTTSVLRITKSAGTYVGGGKYWVRVTYRPY
jgi:hypothetical protein